MACRRLVPLLALLLPVCASAQTVREQPVKWQVNDGLCEPETVLHDPAQDLLIVSNICGFKHNGKGYLSLPGRKLIVVPTGYDNTIVAFEMD